MWRRPTGLSDEEFDWMLRETLRADTAGMEPSPEVWEHIRVEIERPAPRETRPARPPLLGERLGTALQGALMLLVVLGAGLTFAHRTDRSVAIRPTVAYVSVADRGLKSTTYPQDALTVRRLNNLAQQPEPGDWRFLP